MGSKGEGDRASKENLPSRRRKNHEWVSELKSSLRESGEFWFHLSLAKSESREKIGRQKAQITISQGDS